MQLALEDVRNRSVKRQDARDARKLEEPSDEVDRFVAELLAAAVRFIGFLDRASSSRSTNARSALSWGLRNLPFRRQVPIAVDYKSHRVGESCLDLMVADRIVVELKAVEALAPIHWVQVRSYLKATGCLVGLLINFNVPVLLRGVRRIIPTF